MSTHRYRWAGVRMGLIEAQVPGTPVLVGVGPVTIADVSLADDAFKPDLDEAMALQGYVFVETSPDAPIYPTLRQAQMTTLDSDESVVGTTYETLLAIVLDTGGGDLRVTMSASVSTLLSSAEFRLRLDGAPIPGGGAESGLVGASGLHCAVPVAASAGNHTVDLQWRSGSALGTVQCRPATVSGEHCSLEVAELGTS